MDGFDSRALHAVPQRSTGRTTMERRCEQKLSVKSGEETRCPEKAVARVFWPGRPPLDSCMEHARQAQKVGDAIGCYIGVEEIRE